MPYPYNCTGRDEQGRRCLLDTGHTRACMGSDRQFDYFPMSAPAGTNGRIIEKLQSFEELVRVQRLDPRAKLPTRSHEGDAGWDLHVLNDTVIPPYEFVDLPTGIAIAPPTGIWARVVGRSSTLRKRGLLVIEGVIDSGWRDDLTFGVRNLTGAHIEVASGDRLAQLILQRHVDVCWEETNALPPGDRNKSGFGSTGR